MLAALPGTSALAQTYSNAVMALNPAGYWPLNETTQPPQILNITATNSGSFGAAANGYYGAWYQSSGNQWYLTNNIAMESGPISGDEAMNCQQTAGQYIILPRRTNGVANAAVTITAPFSIEAWINLGSVNKGLLSIISEGGETTMNIGGPNPTNQFYGGSADGWDGFAFGTYKNEFFFDCYETNGESKANELDSPANLVAGQWMHVVCTYDGSHEIIYTNGVQAGGEKTVNPNGAGVSYVVDPTSPLMIGSGPVVPVSYGNALWGGLAEVAIYNQALSPSRIQAHYAAATSVASYTNAVLADNPTIYFRMNDGEMQTNAGYPSASFPVATNYGTLGNLGDGVYQPGTTPGVAGPPFAGFGTNSTAVAINGWLGAVDVGNSNIPTALNPTGAVPMTVVSWFQGGPADNPGRFQEIVGHSDNSYRLALGQTTPVGENHFNPGPGPELQFTSAAQVITNGFAFNDGNWHMVAGVSDGTNDYLYLDGSLALSNNSPTGIKILGSTDDLLLGGDPEYTYPTWGGPYNTIRNFDGQIAQVAFWTNALTATQIQSLFAAAGVPPYLWQQPSPSSATVNQGQNVSISTGFRGSNLSYQWYQNGTAVAGQTNANLAFSPATTANAGTYYVVASNAAGAVTSSVVNVTVYGVPTVTEQTSTNLQIFVGSSPTLYVTANGETPTYQWELNGAAIPGATNSSYTLTNLQVSGTYGCALTNSLGNTAIAPIVVTALADPTAPYPAQVLANGPIAYFRLDEAPGTPTAFDYVGGFNGAYTNVVLGNPGYTSGDTIQSDQYETSALFGYDNPPNNYVGGVPPQLNFSAPSGSNVELTVEAWVNETFYNGVGNCIIGLGYGGGEQFVLDTGATATGYVRFFARDAAGAAFSASSTNYINGDGLWHHLVGVCDEAGGHLYLYMDGKLIATGTIPANSGFLSSSMPLTIGSRESGNPTPPNYDDQFYGYIDDVSVYNKALTAAQVQADYNASGVPPLNVQVQPSNVTTNQGANVTFTATTQGGTPPLVYQWNDQNNNPIPGQTNSSLTLTNVQSAQGGTYTLTVTNDYGTASVPVTLTVNAGPAQISQNIEPTNVTAYVGDSVTLSIQASGSLPSYQWYQDGAAVSGATNAAYTFGALAGTNTYYCVVTNAYSYSEGSGPVYSSTATVVGETASTVNPANFNSKLKITFSGYTRPETLSYFPVLVSLSTNLPGFSYAGFASPNGSDLRFADSTGTRELAYEIDQWDDSNGVSSVWVQVPSLSGTNTSIWAYWGNPNDTTPPAYTTNGAVWEPASFLGLPGYDVVYHLQQTNFPYVDSTTNYPALTGVAPGRALGIVGYAGVFTGSQYLDAGDVNLGNQFTESAWVNLAPNESNIQGIWCNGPGGYSTAEAVMFINDYNTADGALLFGVDNAQPETATGLVNSNQWYLVTAAVNRSAATIQFYVDGNPEAASSGVTSDFPTNADMNLGRFTGGSFPLDGMMEEARIHAGIDDSNWVWADYMTVASNSVFTAYSSVTNIITLPITLTIRASGTNVILSWPAGALQAAPVVTGPYTTVNGATSPYTNAINGAQEFYRVQAQY